MDKLDYSQNLQVIVNLALMERVHRQLKLASDFNAETLLPVAHSTKTDKLFRLKQALDLNKDHSEMLSKAIIDAMQEALDNIK